MDDNQEHSVDKWYLVRIVEAIIGAIYNVNQSIAEVITGLPPLSIWNKMNSIKHYLKTFQHSLVSKRRQHGLQNHEIEWMFRINNRKRFEKRGSLPGVEKDQTRGVFYRNRTQPNGEKKSNLSQLDCLSSKCFSYDRSQIAKYSVILWQESMNKALSLEGKANIPKLSCEPLPIPPDFSRLDEVLYMRF